MRRALTLGRTVGGQAYGANSRLGSGLKSAAYHLAADAYCFSRTRGAVNVARFGEAVSSHVGLIAFTAATWAGPQLALQGLLPSHPLLAGSPYGSEEELLAELGALESRTGTVFALHGVRGGLEQRGGQLHDGGAQGERLRAALRPQAAFKGAHYISADGIDALPDTSLLVVAAARMYVPPCCRAPLAAAGVLPPAPLYGCGARATVGGLKVNCVAHHPFEAAVARGAAAAQPWAPSPPVDVSPDPTRRAYAVFVWSDGNSAEGRDSHEMGAFLHDGPRCYTLVPEQWREAPGYPVWQTNMTKTLMAALLAEYAHVPELADGGAAIRAALRVSGSAAFCEYYHGASCLPAERGMHVYNTLSGKGLLCCVVAAGGWLASNASKEELTPDAGLLALRARVAHAARVYAATHPPRDVAERLRCAASFEADLAAKRTAATASAAAKAAAERARVDAQAAQRDQRAAAWRSPPSSQRASQPAAGDADADEPGASAGRKRRRALDASPAKAAAKSPAAAPRREAAPPMPTPLPQQRTPAPAPRAPAAPARGAGAADAPQALDAATQHARLVEAIRAASARLPPQPPRNATLAAAMAAAAASLQPLALRLPAGGYAPAGIVLRATATRSGGVLLTLLRAGGEVAEHALPHGAEYRLAGGAD